MNIVRTDGCVVSGISIDNVDLRHMSEDLKKSNYNQILEYLKNNYSEYLLQEICNFITEILGEFEELYTCEQCGDTVCEYRVEI